MSLTSYWFDLLFGLISAALLAYCRCLSNKIKKYHKMLEERNREDIEDLIEEKLKKIYEELGIDENKFDAIKERYKYKLVRSCEEYLEKGYMTPDEYSALSELWKTYHDLGGNSQGEDYYHRTEKLPIHEEKGETN
ncbi:hypothetical protein [Megamonas funiformis]|uniref:hypothetical protein n=1 Tax=Megamonas funiformis TaxID=437897 RepID=UPI003F8135EE